MEVREPQELREIAAEKLGLLGNGKSTQRIENRYTRNAGCGAADAGKTLEKNALTLLRARILPHKRHLGGRISSSALKPSFCAFFVGAAFEAQAKEAPDPQKANLG
jgi:hypothetical protein